MSDILIYGMETPKDGSCIQIVIDDDGKVYPSVEKCILKTGSIAAAVPVPPHGRLIDAEYVRDTIIQEWMDKADDSYMYKRGMEDAYEVIRNAPTIIPAEEVE